MQSGHKWDTSMFSDRERQEKFKKLMVLLLFGFFFLVFFLLFIHCTAQHNRCLMILTHVLESEVVLVHMANCRV